MAYGNEHGLVIVDIVQKICLLNVASPDLYGAQDPYSRTPRSPKRIDARDEQTRSPSIDQVSISNANAKHLFDNINVKCFNYYYLIFVFDKQNLLKF